jgi:hypothetical protein
MRRENPVWNASCGVQAQTRTETVNRRVGVTAQSRQSQAPVEKHALKLVTEIAAPSSFNGPQHAPSPAQLTSSADGSRANWRMTTSIGFSDRGESQPWTALDGVSSLRFPGTVCGRQRRMQGFTASRQLRAPLHPALSPNKTLRQL